MAGASRGRWKERLHAPLFVLMSGLLLYVSWLSLQEANRANISLPIFFDTPYLAARTLVSFFFLGFFLLLMVRHLFLLVFSVLDQVDRTLAERRWERSTAPKFTPLISIIAPAFNEGKVIEASIRSLLALNYPRYEVLIIDDGSTDDTLERARTLEGEYPNARVQVLWKPNGGKSSALNYGIARSAGEFFLCMDSDSTLSVDALAMAVRYLEDPDVAAVAGAVEVTNLNTIWSKLQYLEYIKGLNLVRRAQGFVRAVSIVPGPIGLFRTSAVAGVGYYAHDTFAEDCEIGRAHV